MLTTACSCNSRESDTLCLSEHLDEWSIRKLIQAHINAQNAAGILNSAECSGVWVMYMYITHGKAKKACLVCEMADFVSRTAKE